MKNVYKFLLTIMMMLCIAFYGIAQAPLANAGGNKTICEDATSYTLVDATASGHTTITWTTVPGGGSFTDASVIQAVYNPNAADKTAGFATLTITAVKSGWVTPTTDNMILNFYDLPDVTDLTLDYSIDETNWEDVGGTNPDFELCIDSLNEYYYLDVDDLIANVALKQSEYNAFYLDETQWPIGFEDWWDAKGVNSGAGSGTWQEHMWKIINGNEPMFYLYLNVADYVLYDGLYKDFFSTDATLKLNGNYPNGTYYFEGTVLSADDCTSGTETFTLLIQQVPTANAGSDATICETGSYTVDDATAENYASVTWTTGGNGTFTGIATLTPTYTPGTTDKSTGSVTLTLHAVATSPCVTEDTDDMTLTLQNPPIADAGDAGYTICEDATIDLDDATSSDDDGVLWSISGVGNGTFDDDEDINPTYTPGAADLAVGSVTLKLTAYATDPCTVDDDDETVITYQKSPIADAGDAGYTICEDATIDLDDATADNEDGVLWSISGAGNGTFDVATDLNPTYTPGATDLAAGSVTLKLTASATDPCTVADDDETVITYQEKPTVFAGDDATTCEDTPYTIDDATVTTGLYTAVTWTTNGDGTFDDDSAVNPEYTPGATDADQQGGITLTLSAVPNTPCVSAITNDMILTVAQAPVVNAGPDASICESGVTVTGTATDALSTLWTSYGDGTFVYRYALSTYYTPGTEDIADGSIQIELVAAPISPCTLLKSDDLWLTIVESLPTVFAGADATGCETDGYYISDATATNYSHLLWVMFDADGTFSDENILNPTYSFGPNDIIKGYALVKLVAEAISPCTILVDDQLKITVQDAAEAQMGGDVTICEDDTYTFQSDYSKLSENVTVSYTDFVTWSTDGDGTFEFPDTYCKPTGGEFLGNDGITYFGLGLISNTTGHSSGGYAKYMDQSTGLLPNVQYTVSWRSGYAPVYNALASLWIDLDMDGTFEDSERLITNSSINSNGTTANFTVPSGTDPGEKRLRIRQRYAVTGNNSSNPCNNFTYGETEDYTVFIVGQGGTVVPPTYTPGTDDIDDGSVELCITARAIDPCTVDDTDCMTLNIQLLPVADAGDDDATICEDQTYTLSDATAENYSSLTWTNGGGDGTFSGDPVNPIYTPGSGDIAAGSVTLTLTLQPISPCTATDDDSIDLSIQMKPTVDAGTNTTVCEDIGSKTAVTGVTLDGTVGGGPNDGLLWTHDGDGTSDDDTAEDTYYTQTSNDAGTTVTFTLTATCSDPCTGTVEDSFTVFFQELPEITAIGTLADATYCEDATAIPLDVTIGGGPYSSVLWTTDGDGEIDDATAENTTYAASSEDGNDDVTFTLTVTPEDPCTTTVDDEFSVYIQKLPTTDAGADDTVCEDGTYTLDDASADDYLTVTWVTTFGDGEFDFTTSAINPDYTPGTADILAGSVKLYILAAPISPCATGANDSIVLNIQLLPFADAGDDDTICEGETFTVSNADADNEESVSWTENGTGDLSDETTLTPVYTPGVGESGDVTLTLTAEPVDPCSTSDDDFMVLTINPLPELTVVELQATKTSPVSWFDASGDIDNGYQLCIDGLAATNYNLDIDGLTSTVALEPGIYNEFFHTATVPADFFDYWEGRGVEDGATGWQGIMWDIINGDAPIFYLLYNGSDYQLIDGLKKQFASVDLPLTLPGDYPQGDYTFTGTVEDVNGCISDDVIIAIEFLHAPVANAGSDATIADNQTYTVDDASAENYTTITWSHDGNGTLTGDDGLTPTYTPGTGDAGTVVTLTMFVDPNAPCSQASDEMTITVKFAPGVTITTPAAPWKFYDNDLTAEGTATDGDGTVVLVEVNLDNAGWEDTGEINPWAFEFTDLAPGKHTLQARATDDDGYVSDIVSVDFYIHLQQIPLIAGWQLISSFLDPNAPKDMPSIMSGVVSNLVTMNALPSGIYAPAPFNINTIGDWNVQKGYKLKMKAPATLTIAGDPLDNNDPAFAVGFHYMPVLTDQLSTISDVFDNPGNPGTLTVGDIMYMTDLTNVYWPAGGLNNITNLIPGRAYYAQFINAVTVDFPDYQGYLVDEALQPPVIPTGPWACVRGTSVHIISLEQKAIDNLQAGYIGAFDAQGNCIGFAEIGLAEGNVGLLVYGNDEWTEAKDGANENEIIYFRHYNNADQSETALTAEFDISKPQYDGKFMTGGLSMIKSFYKTSTGIGEFEASSIQIYPNPAKDVITISYSGKVAVSEVSFTTADGNLVRIEKLSGPVTNINISDLAPGVYFVQFKTETGTKYTKLVVQ